MFSWRSRPNQLAAAAVGAVIAGAIFLQRGHPGYHHTPGDPSAPSGSDAYAQNIAIGALLAIVVVIAVWSWWVFRPRDDR